MQFEIRREGPAEVCGHACRVWVDATGAITADTPRVFEAFAKRRDLRGMTIVLNSDGGSVLGAIALGRAIRRLGMTTTVGRTVDLPSVEGGEKRSRLLPDAQCESMCTFVLLAGVERQVPPQARVLVHQIWLGDRRDDPTSATYSAEDLAVVQRDIGRLAKYTMEMVGSIDLLVLALRIPPWEPMHMLTREELRRTRLITADHGEAGIAAMASASPLAIGPRAAIARHRSWIMVEKSGQPALSRRHPLTIQGEEIGSFELTLSCGERADRYAVSYVEERTVSENGSEKSLRSVELYIGEKQIRLDAVPHEGRPIGHDYMAAGSVPAAYVKAYAEPRNWSLRVETLSADGRRAVIRVGNAGLLKWLPQLAAKCVERTAKAPRPLVGAN
ncbi:MAG TPA: hypothetical protein VNL39_12350 [Xanthobacteraceae bacterium]|nr:hypothetical protein [Xanthobacteraceae bacterium]